MINENVIKVTDFSEWISPTKTRNWILGEPFLDWLDLYGSENGYKKDTELEDYLSVTDFSDFIMRKGVEFESKVVEAVAQRLGKSLDMQPEECVVKVAESGKDISSQSLRDRTLALMQEGVPAIYQGVLWHQGMKIYGIPDLLVRADCLCHIWDKSTPDNTELTDEILEVERHYVVVDVKYTGFEYSVGGELKTDDSNPIFTQLALYNLMLGKAQGYRPTVGYFIGRSWKQAPRTVKGVRQPAPQSKSALSRGIQVNLSHDVYLQTAVTAIKWYQEVKANGRRWKVGEQVSVNGAIIELKPNMKNERDSYWHSAKIKIQSELGNSDAQSGTNEATDVPLVIPERLENNERSVWRNKENSLEFYVDFENFPSVADDFSAFPNALAEEKLFMIGCGYWDKSDEWNFKIFYAENLKSDSEQKLVDDWITHMTNVEQQFNTTDSRVYHWSDAEPRLIQSYCTRRDKKIKLNWFDFLVKVLRGEKVEIRGASSKSIKEVAKALHNAGKTMSIWGDVISDGQAAMVAGVNCYEIAARQYNGDLKEVKIMFQGQEKSLFEIMKEYNEADCLVMAEIIRYFRQNH